MKRAIMKVAAPASLRRSWVARSACAALIALATATQTNADADLPASWKVELSPKLLAVLRPLCASEGGSADASKWEVFKTTLDENNSLYLAQCIYPASNDVHLVLTENKDGVIAPASLFDQNPKVWNVRFAADPKDMIDTSGGGAGCSSTRTWRWEIDHFKLLNETTSGC